MNPLVVDDGLEVVLSLDIAAVVAGESFRYSEVQNPPPESVSALDVWLHRLSCFDEDTPVAI